MYIPQEKPPRYLGAKIASGLAKGVGVVSLGAWLIYFVLEVFIDNTPIIGIPLLVFPLAIPAASFGLAVMIDLLIAIALENWRQTQVLIQQQSVLELMNNTNMKQIQHTNKIMRHLNGNQQTSRQRQGVE